jgi:phage terminase large subunit-like protein
MVDGLEGQYPPKIEYTVMSLDTAFTKKTTSDYSAVTMWGVFIQKILDKI